MNILEPIPVTDAMFGAGSIAEDPTTVWAAGTFAIGDERHVVATHSVYRCAVAGASALSPELDPTRWARMRPTNRWAPFGLFTPIAGVTKRVLASATATTSLTYVLVPGKYFNAAAIYLPVGAQYSFTVKETAGGAVIYGPKAGFIWDDPVGMWEYLFVEPIPRPKLLFTDIPIRPAAEITLTLTAASGQPVGLGCFAFGDLAPLVDASAGWGGLEHGAEAEPVSYSGPQLAADGTLELQAGYSATNVSGHVKLPREFADASLARFQRVLNKPVAFVGSKDSKSQGLHTFGIATGAMGYDGPRVANFNYTARGLF